MSGNLPNQARGPVSGRAIGYAVALHLILVAIIWVMGVLMRPHQEEIIPIDLTVVPPWATQTDDPEPDPNPPPKPQPKVKPQPKPDPAPEKKVEPKVDAVEKFVEKKKPPEKPKPPKKKDPPPDLTKDAKFVDQKPVPQDLRAEAKRIDPPPQIKTTGKGTAADKPLSPEEFMRLMNQGYRIGSRNQIANNEVSRCYSLIVAAIRRACEQDGIRWNAGQKPVLVNISFGAGGRITSYKLAESCGDPNIDRRVVNAIGRLGAINGLSSTFLQEYPVVPAQVKPTGY